MKYLLLFVLLTLVGFGGYLLWEQSKGIDSTGKIHADLYQGANGIWDPQLQVLPFDFAPTTQLTLRWQAPEQEYNHFVITISQLDGTLVRKESGEHDRLSLDPDGLEPGTEYVFALQACLDRSCEQWLIGKEEYRGTTAEASEPREEKLENAKPTE